MVLHLVDNRAARQVRCQHRMKDTKEESGRQGGLEINWCETGGEIVWGPKLRQSLMQPYSLHQLSTVGSHMEDSNLFQSDQRPGILTKL